MAIEYFLSKIHDLELGAYFVSKVDNNGREKLRVLMNGVCVALGTMWALLFEFQ